MVILDHITDCEFRLVRARFITNLSWGNACPKKASRGSPYFNANGVYGEPDTGFLPVS